MENALLILHLVIVIALIAVVLVQRSEGGALGIGGGGGGLVTGRGAATALQRVTWYLGGGFIATSLALTILASAGNRAGSVFDNVSPNQIGLPQTDGTSFTPPLLGNSANESESGGDSGAGATFTPPTLDGSELSLPNATGTAADSGAAVQTEGSAPSGFTLTLPTQDTVTEPSNLVPAAPAQ